MGYDITTTGSAPLFIVGAQRSGTTMLRLMLDSHSNIAIPFETAFIVPLFYEWRNTSDGDEALRQMVEAIKASSFVKRSELGAISASAILSHVRDRSYAGVVDALFRTWAYSKGKARWGDKTPGVPDIHVLGALFPGALFLHIIRDGRDVAVSRTSTWGERGLLHIAHDWCWKVDFARRLGATMGERYFEIKYEAIVLQTEASLRSIVEWMGEAYEDSMCKYHLTAAQRLPADSVALHHTTSIQPPDRQKVGTWKEVLSKGEIALFDSVAGPLLQELGYAVDSHCSLSHKLARRMALVREAITGHAGFRAPCLASYQPRYPEIGKPGRRP
jgi:hypothetical protein